MHLLHLDVAARDELLHAVVRGLLQLTVAGVESLVQDAEDGLATLRDVVARGQCT